MALLGGGAFIFAWLMPNHNPPWTSANQEFASFFAGLVLVLVILLFRLTRITPGIVGFFMLACIPPLQWWVGLIIFSGDAWITSVFLFGFALMVMVGYNLSLKSESRYFFSRVMAGVLIAGAVFSLWVAIRQWLQFPSGDFWVIDLPRGGRPYANLAQPNSLATLLCMGLAGTLYLFERHALGRFAAGLLASFLLFGVALTQSRTPWVLSIAVLGFWGWKAYGGRLRLSLLSLLGWIGLYVIYLLALPTITDSLLLISGDPLERAGNSERLTMWGQLLFAVIHGPLWGYGWGQVSVAQIEVAVVYPALGLTTLYSHNILLDLLVWNGPIIGGLIIFLISVWLLRIGWAVRTSEGLFALLAAGCVLVHAMLEYPLSYAFFLFPLGLLLGLAAVEVSSTRKFEMPVWLLGGFFLIAIGLFVWFWKEYRVLEEYYRVSRFEQARILGETPGEVPEVFLLSEPREYIRLVRMKSFEGMSETRLDWMRKVAYRRPGAFSLFRYALALGINGRPADAHEQLKIVRAQYGQRVYDQALDELKRQEDKYPQLAAVRKESVL